MQINTAVTIPDNEIQFQFSRSGGPGGQNVNKVSTRVELLFDVRNSKHLSEEQKLRVQEKLGSRIDSEHVLHVASQESRSQWKNREHVIEKFASLMRTALAMQKKRRSTKPTRSSKENRVKLKKAIGSKKKLRGRVNPHE